MPFFSIDSKWLLYSLDDYISDIYIQDYVDCKERIIAKVKEQMKQRKIFELFNLIEETFKSYKEEKR
ncbi:hypothetical protein BBF96_13055 [Anoxybacter fermentans]|uniref:Uncharacterized protein n=1 Tax=Anoxybacter fermentans TaxID=1323375 RepID=A0A3S9T165_9FIRM|nr:hypothetical protein BBF96_13055 [Anoxybacter fermentans]